MLKRLGMTHTPQLLIKCTILKQKTMLQFRESDSSDQSVSRLHFQLTIEIALESQCCYSKMNSLVECFDF